MREVKSESMSEFVRNTLKCNGKMIDMTKEWQKAGIIINKHEDIHMSIKKYK